VLQCAAVCCSMLQCDVVCCSVLQCVALAHIRSDSFREVVVDGECVRMCCSVLHCVSMWYSVLHSVLQCFAVLCKCVVLANLRIDSLRKVVVDGECVAVCCIMLQCVAVWCSVV